MVQDGREEEVLVTLSDFLSLCRRSRKKILLGTLFFTLLALLYAATRPIEYGAEATFRERHNTESGMNESSLTTLLFSGGGDDSEAISMMKSRKLLERLVEQEEIQAVLTPKEGKPGIQERISDNLFVEWAYLTKKKEHALPETSLPIEAVNLVYFREVPLKLDLVFDEESRYHVLTEAGQQVYSGRLGEPCFYDDVSFTLVSSEVPSTGEHYLLTLLPKGALVESLLKKMEIEQTKKDKQLIRLNYYHPDRHVACRLVNQLMLLYQNYLREQHERTSYEQVAYLQKRENALGEELKLRLSAYADTLSQEMSELGFANTDLLIEFLASHLKEAKQRLQLVDLDLKRLEKARREERFYFEQTDSGQGIPTVNTLQKEILAYKQKCDAINLALRQTENTPGIAFQEVFEQQVAELEEIQTCAEEAKRLIQGIEEGNPTLSPLVDHPKYRLRPWWERLERARGQGDEQWNSCRENILAYLYNLSRFFQLYANTLREGLSHQRTPQLDFQGITLDVATELYVTYNTELSLLESETVQHAFLIEQIDDPEFQLSSLCDVLSDPVTGKIVTQAMEIQLALSDENNRSEKEQERLSVELMHQKGFIISHLKQALHFLKLKEELLKSKIQGLLNAMVGLYEQQISILEQNLTDYLDSRLHHLKHERELITQWMDEIYAEMETLPKKWANEKLINQHLRMNETMVEEMTRLVESKMITNNLELIQSSPIDFATPALHPKRPNLLLFAALGALAGAVLMVGWVSVSGALRGVLASRENLILAGAHVAGDGASLETLRRALSHVLEEDEHQRRVLLVVAKEACVCVDPLLQLMHQQGKKVCHLNLTDETSEKVGLLQVVEGRESQPEMVKGERYDEIGLGGKTRYRAEIVAAPRFCALIDDLLELYDWVVISTDSSPLSAETEALLHPFDRAVIVLTDEKIEEMRSFLFWIKEEWKRVSFVFS